jgi:hypothetical protein
MTESALQPHAAHSHKAIRTVCQIAMWAIVGLKVIWLAMALVFVGPRWQVLLFGCALLMLAAATWSFGTGSTIVMWHLSRLLYGTYRSLGIGLAWFGVLVAVAVGYFGGPEPGALTDRIHDQFRTHIADFVFLAVAHLQFWALGNITPKPIVPANVS